MPKKSGKKSANKDSKKVKNATKVADNEPVNAGQSNSKQTEDKLQRNEMKFMFVPSVATVDLSSTTDAEIAAETVEEGRKYSKRKIQSNWQRYEIPDDSSQVPESATTRGYDFELVTNTGGGIGSHFQFQDEKDWDEELNSDSDSVNQLQSLDLNSLALSLSCIPFHQRLGIDPKYFTTEQIRKFEEVAQLQQVKYENKSLASDKQERQIGNVKVIQPFSSAVETLNTFTIEKKNTGKEAVASVSHTSLPQISQGKETPIEDELEDELDALLALNSGKVQNMRSIDISALTLAPGKEHPIVPIVKPVPEITAISEESMDDWLDSALED